MTLHERVLAARRHLIESGIPEDHAASDAEVLARAALGWDRAAFLSSRHAPTPPGFDAAYDALVARRRRREPVAYILGRREFWGLDFEVGPGVLVPRPESEMLVEEALARAGRLPVDAAPRIADVGTGSGCLAVSLAHSLVPAFVVATDLSWCALTVARRNAVRHGVADRVRFVQANLLAGLAGRFDIIVSNPPYIPDATIPILSPEVRDFEPLAALDGGEDGLDPFRGLLDQADDRLAREGTLIVEFGWGQEEIVHAAVSARPTYVVEEIKPDLQGIPRAAVIRRR